VPRVSPDHLEARRAEIVRAALRCFARDGFHATSVRDVIRESGLSTGAVYSYFPSKGDLIAGATEPILQALTTALDTLVDPERAADPDRSPAEATAAVLRHIYPLAVGGEADFTRIAITAWAEALRDPAVRGIVERTYGAARQTLAARTAHWRDAGHLPPDTDTEALAQVLFSTLLGFITQVALLGDVDLDRYTGAMALLLPPRASPRDPDFSANAS